MERPRQHLVHPLLLLLLLSLVGGAAATTGADAQTACEPTNLATQIALFCAPDMPTAPCCEPVVASVDLGGGVPCLCRVAAQPQLILARLNASHLLALYTACGGLRTGGAHLAAACQGPSPPPPAIPVIAPPPPAEPRHKLPSREPPPPPTSTMPSPPPQQQPGGTIPVIAPPPPAEPRHKLPSREPPPPPTSTMPSPPPQQQPGGTIPGKDVPTLPATPTPSSQVPAAAPMTPPSTNSRSDSAGLRITNWLLFAMVIIIILE